MELIEPASLLTELGANAPCGTNLEYDPAFASLERAVQSAPQERLVGPDVAPDEPNWPTIVRQAVELFDRTKDIVRKAMSGNR